MKKFGWILNCNTPSVREHSEHFLFVLHHSLWKWIHSRVTPPKNRHLKKVRKLIRVSEGKKLIRSVVSGWNCFECAKISRTTSLTNRLFGFSYGLLKNTTKSAQIKFFIKKFFWKKISKCYEKASAGRTKNNLQQQKFYVIKWKRIITKRKIVKELWKK